MRINKLEFSAVGPFDKVQTIDFDMLGPSALYLIDGPTGAGKSTIIDCIVYALFNEMSGEASDDARIRSQFATPTTQTYVELTFTNTKGTFRVKRSPEYQREKARGEGLTPVKASAVLWRVEADGTLTPMATQPREANTLLREEIVGLTKEQFTQTVVLPQGEFATFLRADTKEREPLLSKIFATDIYKKVAEVLKEQQKAIKTQSEGLTANILQTLAQFQTSVDYSEEQRDAISKMISATMDAEVLAEIEDALSSVKTVAENAAARAIKALALKQAAETTHNQRKSEKKALEDVARDTSLVEAREAELTSALEQLSGHLADLSAAGITIGTDLTVEQWAETSAQLSKLIGKIGEARAAETRVAGAERRQQAIRDEITAHEAQLESVVARLGELPAIIESLRSRADPTAALARLDVIKSEIDKLAEQKAAHKQLAELKADAETATKAVTTAQAVATEKQHAHQSLVAQRIAGMAGELASELKPGDACQVCGSTAHPQLATRDEGAATAEQVDAAGEELNAALSKLEAARTKSEQVNTKLAALQATITTVSEEIDSRLGELNTEQTTLRQTVAAADSAKSQLDAAIAEQSGSSDQQTATKVAIAELGAKLKADVEQTKLDEQAAIEARANFASVEERTQSLTGANTAMQKCSNAQNNVDIARGALVASNEVLAGFVCHDQFADVESAAADLAEAADAHDNDKTFSDNAALRLKDATTQADLMREGIKQRAEVVAGSSDLIKLADVFNKDKAGQGINIYVLQALFDDVLQSANSRFSSLLEGRYRLVVSDEKDGHASSVRGLGLNVLDTRTGVERTAKTLSGGESFCASLSLALGMADIVRANAGGISIETLFIDEGFGSLDGTRLNDVMNMLQGLQMAGRTVGVISHVDEMKGQIQERINVIPGGKDQPTAIDVTWMQ